VDNEGPRSTIGKPKGAPTGHQENRLNYVRIAPCLILAFGLAACSGSSSDSTNSAASPGEAGSAAPGGKTIGLSIQNREAQFYQDMEAGMQAEAKKNGYTLIVVDANRDNAKQQSQVEDFISKKVDAIVLTPFDSQAIGSAIVEANSAKERSSRISPATTFKAALKPAS
jgi:ABC-type sugar transport system substrate-binding protein